MAWLISALGAALALAGAVSLANAIPYIRLDWGQAETVAGTVAVSGGVVTLALGAVLFTLRDGARRLATAFAASAPPAISAEQPVADRNATHTAVPAAERVEPVLARTAPPERDVALVGPADDAPSRPDLSGEVEPSAIVDAPTVVGRYESNGASYVLFSDGTIEVETGQGTHRFASMDALKHHIERQSAG